MTYNYINSNQKIYIINITAKDNKDNNTLINVISLFAISFIIFFLFGLLCKSQDIKNRLIAVTNINGLSQLLESCIKEHQESESLEKEITG